MANRDQSNAQDTIVGTGLQIKGHLKSLSRLEFDGTIVGNISCEADVILGPNAYVEGNVSCQNLQVAGTVAGNIKVGASLVLYPTAKLKGDIATKSLMAEEGAIINGQLEMPIPETDSDQSEEPVNPKDN